MDLKRIDDLIALADANPKASWTMDSRQEFVEICKLARRALEADADLERRRAYYASCQSVGLSARWCPSCGDCICPDDGDLDQADCPLHGTKSIHCAPPSEDALDEAERKDR